MNCVGQIILCIWWKQALSGLNTNKQKAVWQSQMGKQSRSDLAIYYPVTSYCCCYEAEVGNMASTEILDSIKKQHPQRNPYMKLSASDTQIKEAYSSNNNKKHWGKIESTHEFTDWKPHTDLHEYYRGFMEY